MTTTYAAVDNHYSQAVCVSHTIPAGQAVVLRPQSAPWTLHVIPGNGGSALVEVSCSSGTNPDAMHWHTVDTSTTSDIYRWSSPVSAIRVTAAVSDAVVEMVA